MTVRCYATMPWLIREAGCPPDAAYCAARRAAAYDPLPARMPANKTAGLVLVADELVPWLGRELERGAEWCARPLRILEAEREGQLMPDFITLRRLCEEWGTSTEYVNRALRLADPIPVYTPPGKAKGRVAPVKSLTAWLRRNDGEFLAEGPKRPAAGGTARLSGACAPDEPAKPVDALRLADLAALWGCPIRYLYEARRDETDPLPCFRRKVPGANKPAWFCSTAGAAAWAQRRRAEGGLPWEP